METPPLPPPETPAAEQTRKRKRNIRISRDTVLVTAGLLGIMHETVVQHGERPSLLILFAAMLGLPAYLRRNGM